jgi:hypothetical protein
MPKRKRPVNMTLRTFVPPVIEPCAGCGEIHSYVSIQLPNKRSLCFRCFETQYPQHAAVNRFKKPNEQLEIPFWED